MQKNDATRREISTNLSEADARKLTLPSGTVIYILVKEGSPYLPNPELAKILPAVNRTAMEHFRNSYGISVSQASKTDMDVMKCLGVVSMKAGRTLLYKVADVVSMFTHWKLRVPGFIEEMARGKILGERVNLGASFPQQQQQQGLSGMLPGDASYSQTPSPIPRTNSPSPFVNSSLLSAQVANHTPQDGGSTSSSGSPQKRAWPEGVIPDTSPLGQRASLTPDQFQLPVSMLNSLAAEGGASGGVAEGLESTAHKKKAKRRSSSISGSPLDDQELEYCSITWGEESLTLLCPSNGTEEPYVPIPELLQKVLHQRSFISVQQRTQLGVTVHPATSLQVHALRARGSVDTSTGNVRLVSLSDAVKLAVNGRCEIPGTIIQKLAACSEVPLQEILNPMLPAPDSKPASSSTSSSSSSSSLTLKQEALSSSLGGEAPRTRQQKGVANSGSLVPVHPDITPSPCDWRLDGEMCKVKWGEGSVVVYINSTGQYFMGLYQVYDSLFKCYVTRMNFKMRMRKLDIRSNRAPSSIRMKLVELDALPSNCPVCGLITVREMETLAKSYGVTPPQVFYESFLAQGQGQAVQKPAGSQQLRMQATPTSSPSQQQQQLPQNLFSYQFDPSDDHPSPSHVPRPLKPSSGQYGIVPYLTSSSDRVGGIRPAAVSSPNLIMTSLGTTRLTNQIHLQDRGGGEKDGEGRLPPLVISIPREYTRFKVLPHYSVPGPSAGGGAGGSKAGNLYPGGSRGKVLQSLAKKISQKSRKLTMNSLRSSASSVGGHTNSVGGRDPHLSSASATSLDLPKGTSRQCPSCHQWNAQHKKRCGFCNEFIVGTPCPSCHILNYYRSKTCSKCGANMPEGQVVGSHDHQHHHHQQGGVGVISSSHEQQGGSGGGGEVPGSGTTSDSSHPTSPSSPKFAAPPIRNAVLKSLFPQSKGPDSVGKATSGSGGSSGKGGQQVISKATYPGGGSGGGGAASVGGASRKCLECGHLNTRMAKKCVKCRSHLQGRACTRCGRPNLNHVTECYKCGASLPPSSSSKWVYLGSHSGRAYKSTTSTVETVETRMLSSRAPTSCIRCTKFRSAGYFKCGRCGDAFRTRPLVDPLWSVPGEDTPPPSKKQRKELADDQANKDSEKIDASLLQSLARNLIEVGLQDSLIPQLLATETETRQQLEAAEGEFGAADAEYQVMRARKKAVENSFNQAKAELDSLLLQVESTTKAMQEVEKKEEAARKETETLPAQIEALKSKIAASVSLFSADE